MAVNATQRREKVKEFERRRQAELGGERGREEPDRGREEPDRGREEPDRGGASNDFGPNQVALDIFRTTAGLGGHLIVAFVAPVAPSYRSSLAKPKGRLPSSDVEAQAAAARAVLAAFTKKEVQKRKEARTGSPSPS
jgi:hypothetical protein